MIEKSRDRMRSVMLLVSLVVIIIIGLGVGRTEAYPLDLYDDVSDLFQAMTLDEVPGAQGSQGAQEVQEGDASSHDIEKKDPKKFCRMPARKGVCRALIPRWSYNADKKNCVEFKFGGCDGNDNNFSSYKECMAQCKNV